MSDIIAIAGTALGHRTGHEAGRSLLAQLYHQTTGQPLPQICIERFGKPYFAEGDIHFSITHTKRHAFCVLADREVGIDAEELDRNVSPKLARKILSPGELMQYEAAEDKRKALLTFWVLKEAAVKATGLGLRGYPDHTNFSLDDPRVEERDGCLVAVVFK